MRANDTDPDGDVLNTVLVSPPVHGTLIFFADGSFWYLPDAKYNGPDEFTYRSATADWSPARPMCRSP